MLVVAALRWVDARATVDPLTGAVRANPLTAGAGEADLVALEYALRLAEAWSGRCVAVTVGPVAAENMLRDALAAGASEAVRISEPDADRLATEDGRLTAQAIADAVRARYGRPDLVICGDRSADRGTGATPAFLAAELNASQALGLLELEPADGGLRALRRLDGGRRERLAVPLPAVCSVEPAEVRLRRASLPAMLAARNAPIPVLPVGRIGALPTDRVRAGATRPYRPRPKVLPAPAGERPHDRLRALTGALGERHAARVVTPDSPAAAVDELLNYLRERGYLAGETE